jgi:hypothetical protein
MQGEDHVGTVYSALLLALTFLMQLAGRLCWAEFCASCENTIDTLE